MIRRTTIELDDALLEAAKIALGSRTTRATVEEALRQAIARADDATAQRARAQTAYLDQLESFVDLEVLGSDKMWR